MKSNFDLFLFDADDTLFDFSATEISAFKQTIQSFDIDYSDSLFSRYKTESEKLWRELELGKTTKDHLKVQRFRNTFEDLDLDFDSMSSTYLDRLSEGDHLMDHAIEICEYLSRFAEIGIVTNGIESVQSRRFEKSPLKKWIQFMVVSEECGHAKPDPRFFEHTMKKAGRTSKEGVLVIGDRIETDVLGANQFGLKSCWYNPRQKSTDNRIMDYEISCLSELKSLI